MLSITESNRDGHLNHCTLTETPNLLLIRWTSELTSQNKTTWWKNMPASKISKPDVNNNKNDDMSLKKRNRGELHEKIARNIYILRESENLKNQVSCTYLLLFRNETTAIHIEERLFHSLLACERLIPFKYKSIMSFDFVY